MRKAITLILVLLMVATLFTGCSTQTAEPAAAPAEAEAAPAAPAAEAAAPAEQEPVTISIMSRFSDETAIAKCFQARLQAFRDAHPDITVEDLSVIDENDYYNRLRSSIASGDVPNVFCTYTAADVRNYAESGVIEDLAPIMAADPEWGNAFLPFLFEVWQMDDMPGQTWGVPYEYYVVSLYYNKKIFAELGIEPPKTMSEFKEVSKVLSDNGYIPMPVGAKDNWRIGHMMNNVFMKNFSVDTIYKLADRSLAYNSPEMIELFKEIDDLNKAGVFGENPVSLDFNGEKELFFAGKAGMHQNGSWFTGDVAASDMADDIGVVAWPYEDAKPELKGQHAGGSASGFSMAAGLTGREYEASVELLKWMSSVENFTYMSETQQGGIYPVTMDVDPSTVSKITVELLETLADATEIKGDIPNYDPLSSMLDRVRNSLVGMLAGNTPEQCADEIVAEIEKNS